MFENNLVLSQCHRVHRTMSSGSDYKGTRQPEGGVKNDFVTDREPFLSLRGTGRGDTYKPKFMHRRGLRRYLSLLEDATAHWAHLELRI